MSSQGTGASIVLFGLEPTLASELQSVLKDQKAVYQKPFLAPRECVGLVEQLGADLVFCGSDRTRYLALLEAIGRQRPDLPVVVVSRTPEVSEWLDAIEAGASDYCAAPFEASHIQWILDSTLKRTPAPALFRAAG